jgi:ribonuclease HII
MGYSVPEHTKALALLGPTVHHRRSFAPVAASLGIAESQATNEQQLVIHKMA